MSWSKNFVQLFMFSITAITIAIAPAQAQEFNSYCCEEDCCDQACCWRFGQTALLIGGAALVGATAGAVAGQANSRRHHHHSGCGCNDNQCGCNDVNQCCCAVPPVVRQTLVFSYDLTAGPDVVPPDSYRVTPMLARTMPNNVCEVITGDSFVLRELSPGESELFPDFRIEDPTVGVYQCTLRIEPIVPQNTLMRNPVSFGVRVTNECDNQQAVMRTNLDIPDQTQVTQTFTNGR